MRCNRVFLCGLALLAVAAPIRAETPPDPLRLIPDQADVVIQAEHPRQLVETFTALDLLQQLQKLDGVREIYDSTSYRRFYQLLAHFEKQMGARWPEILDRIAGGGLALGFKIGPNPAPALLVVQGKDEEALRQFVKLGLEVIEQEIARQDRPAKPTRGKHRDLETIHIGKEFHAAIAGSALLLSNNEEALHKAIDLHLDSGKNSLAGVASIGEARKLLPPKTLAWAWVNMAPIHNAPEAKEVFKLPRSDPNQTALLGGILDVAGRAPYACIALGKEDDGLLLSIRMPRGREGSAEAMALHIPPAGEGTLPLLEPKGVIYSNSNYVDLAKVWEERAKLFNDKAVKGLEDVDKKSAFFLAGKSMSELLKEVGPHQRFVAVHQDKTDYQTDPGQHIPAFGFVVDMRKKDLGRTLETVLRGVALLGNLNQLNLKLVEEKHGDLTIVSYRFPEGKDRPAKVSKESYNFTPSFVTVGDQFVIASTIELARELVDLLQKEAKADVQKTPAAFASRLYGSGGADFLRAIDDQLFAQTMLERALPPEQAKEQVKEFLALVRRLGTLRAEIVYGAQDFRYDFRWVPAK